MNKLKIIGIGVTAVTVVELARVAYRNAGQLACYKTLTNKEVILKEDPNFVVETLMLKQMELQDELNLGNINYFTYLKEMTKSNREWAIKSGYSLVDKK